MEFQIGPDGNAAKNKIPGGTLNTRSFGKLAACVALIWPALTHAQDTQIYGLGDAWFGQTKTNGNSKTVVDSGGMSTSYWGIGGSEDLGGGLKAVFAFESFFTVDNGGAGRFPGDTFFARDAYVGLSGSFGQSTLGRNTTPYFLSTVIFNPFGDSFTFAPIVAHVWLPGGNPYFVQGDTGFSNSIRYTTPNFSGLSADFAYSAGNERDVAPTGTNKAFDANVLYFSGNWSGTAAYRTINLDAVGLTSKQDSYLLGGAYDFAMAKLYAQYQSSKFDTGASTTTSKTYQLGVAVPAGPGAVLFSLAHSKFDVPLATGDKRDTWALGYDYNLSKRTDLYAVFYDDKFKNPESFKQQIMGLGIRHKF
jgi:predicted porin